MYQWKSLLSAHSLNVRDERRSLINEFKREETRDLQEFQGIYMSIMAITF